MKITYLLPTLLASGGVRVVYEFANRLQKRGHDLTIAHVEGETSQDWFPLNVPIISRDQLIKQAAQNDLVVATGWQTASLCLSLPAKARVYYVQMFEPLFYRNRRRQLDAYATYQWPFDGFVTVSQWLQRMLREEFQQESVIAYNVVNREMFYPDPHFPKENGRLRVLIEGPQAHYKGIKDAYAAVAGLPVEVWALSQEPPLGPVDRAFVLPPQETIRHIYSSCDILVKTSWYEGRPLPHLEAMACGCALISSDMCATDDLVDGYNALIVPPRNVEATRAALLRLIEDQALRERLIQGGLETARQQDWDKSTSDMEQALADILKKVTSRTYQIPPLPPSVHVAFFNETRKEQAQRQLRQLSELISQDDLSLSVINDGSQPEAAAYFAGKGYPVLIKNSPQDYTAIWRQVVEQARQRPILLLNSLIRIDRSDWLQRLLAQLDADPTIGLVGVKIVGPNWTVASAGGLIGPAQKWALDHNLSFNSANEPHFFHNQTSDVDYVDDYCVLIRAETAQDMLDTHMHPFGEGMIDYSVQAKQRGWRIIYFPQIMAWRQAPQTELKDFDFEDLAELDAKQRRLVARQKGVGHYVRVFSRDLKEVGPGEALKRSVNWLKWIFSQDSKQLSE